MILGFLHCKVIPPTPPPSHTVSLEENHCVHPLRREVALQTSLREGKLCKLHRILLCRFVYSLAFIFLYSIQIHISYHMSSWISWIFGYLFHTLSYNWVLGYLICFSNFQLTALFKRNGHGSWLLFSELFVCLISLLGHSPVLLLHLGKRGPVRMHFLFDEIKNTRNYRCKQQMFIERGWDDFCRQVKDMTLLKKCNLSMVLNIF